MIRSCCRCGKETQLVILCKSCEGRKTKEAEQVRIFDRDGAEVATGRIVGGPRVKTTHVSYVRESHNRSCVPCKIA